MKRMTILLGAIAALMLVPAAQAFAAHAVLTVEGEGPGSGKVVPRYPGLYYYGEPEEINCEYISPGPATGVCEAEMMEGPLAETEGIYLKGEAAKGSKFGEWKIEEGENLGCSNTRQPSASSATARPKAAARRRR